MATFVPLISSGVAGPLGVLHLPRLWLKLSLESRGKLDSRYPGAGKGYDQMTIDALGLHRDEVIAYIKDRRPSYTEFEAWIKQHPDAKLDTATIEQHNAAVRGYNHDDATRQSILKSVALPDDGSVRDAVRLNDLDGWQEMYEAELK
jgi:hypothetical protein